MFLTSMPSSSPALLKAATTKGFTKQPTTFPVKTVFQNKLISNSKGINPIPRFGGNIIQTYLVKTWDWVSKVPDFLPLPKGLHGARLLTMAPMPVMTPLAIVSGIKSYQLTYGSLRNDAVANADNKYWGSAFWGATSIDAFAMLVSLMLTKIINNVSRSAAKLHADVHDHNTLDHSAKAMTEALGISDAKVEKATQSELRRRTGQQVRPNELHLEEGVNQDSHQRSTNPDPEMGIQNSESEEGADISAANLYHVPEIQTQEFPATTTASSSFGPTKERRYLGSQNTSPKSS